ncbi:MAG: glutathione synthase [Candidatus Competibacteraceae bacterium]|nr:glutathione synthase [Candidatus Competibacteraceae bacterium]MBK7984295.1 glutathione synthase [Candidatus Competibacteraceae bacterium]MBK8896262.1 glutathione synthase [Candidatus Competibacteraceae bacterium]MBK8964928.1 glutathione synthase [Candidatus Competibacteraceae bacterium]MBK9950209.1 glutathione synthase [Candidatus Competibacteraceae bacterium]
MTIKLGVVMDPIATITIKKDTTFAMLLAAQARGWQLHYFEQADLYARGNKAFGRARRLSVKDDKHGWFAFHGERELPLAELDAMLMRKDPPFDMEYIYTTYLLELAEAAGVLVVNKPSSLRDANEKVFALHFPECCPPTLVARAATRLKAFLGEHEDIVVKPLDGMGGASVFRLRQNDPNLNVILETLTAHDRRSAMAQRYIPEVTAGDKRILLIDGEPVPYALARIPQAGETRANLAAGGRGEGVSLSERDRWICAQVAPKLREMGLLFVGLDVIGDYLTEINVTSPTCARELDAQFGLDIGGELMAAIERRLRR